MPSCRFCGSNELSNDDGGTVCTSCGKVNEESNITSDVAFAEGGDGSSSVIGQFVSDTGMGHGRNPRAVGGQRHHREVTLANGRRRIQHLASALKLSSIHVDAAFRFFMLAVQNNFTQGRRTPNVVAACLYLVCRRHKTPHMLIDFSDVLQANLFVLGNTFFRLCRMLRISPPLIDPSLYIHRFAAALNLGELENEVATTALKLVQRMKRDWMQIGRRPAGVCGAALYIAARIHRVVVPKLIILQTVKVCDMTLRRRVVEFRDAPSAQLTKQEFWKANPDYKGNPEDDLTDNTSENPPVYKQHRKKEAEDERRRRAQLRQQQVPETRTKKTATRAVTSMRQGEELIEGHDETAKASGSAPTRPTFGEATDEEREEAEAIAAATELLGTADVEKAQENAKKRKMPESNAELSAPAAKRMSNDEQEMNSQFDAMIEEENQGDIDGDKESNYGHGVEEQMESALKEGGKFVKANVEAINQPTLAAVPDPEDEEAVKAAIVAKAKAAAAAAAALASEVFDASDIPDEDVEEYINTEDQYVIKSMLWEELNKEWIEDQAEKERLAAEQAATGVVPKKRARKAKSAEERAAEANASKEKSTRINQDALNAARLRREAGGARKHELEGMEDDEDDLGGDEEDDELGIRPRPARPPPSAFLGSLRPTIPTTQNPTQSTQATQAYGAEEDDDDEEEEDDEAPKANFRSQVFGAHDEEEEDYY